MNSGCVIGVYRKNTVLITYLNALSLKFVHRGPVDNRPGLVQIMARNRIGQKLLSGPMLAWHIDADIRHSASVR